MAVRQGRWPGTRQLGPGVVGAGYSPEPGVFIVETLEAQQQGSGDVGRYIDDLKVRYAFVLVQACISPRLEGILKRRGFERLTEDNWGWQSPLAPNPKGYQAGSNHDGGSDQGRQASGA